MSEDKKTILVVEDEELLINAIRKKLEVYGYDIVSARSVIQAVGYLEDLEKIDLVWLDHYLLGAENGLDLVVKMKAENSKWKEIPIFVVSNTATHDKVKGYLHLGVEKFYVKSDYKLDEIINDISAIFNNKSGV